METACILNLLLNSVSVLVNTVTEGRVDPGSNLFYLLSLPLLYDGKQTDAVELGVCTYIPSTYAE